MDPELLSSLRADIRNYVERCVARCQQPDGFAFATVYQREYGRVPGAVIERLINEELTKYER